ALRPGRGAGLPRCRDADRPVGAQARRRGRGDARARRVRRGAAALRHRPGARAEAALGAAAAALGFDWRAAVAIGFSLAMSSTALVLQSLAERGQLSARHGRDAFAILLFQDLAVIPLLALMPLLASGETGVRWEAAAKGLATIVVVIAAGRFAVRPLLRLVARHGDREVFTAAALLLVAGAALGTQWIGLSMSLGAFL